MNGSQQATINEIKKLIEEENIETEAALRLTLASQIIVTEELATVKIDVEKLNKRVGALESYLTTYPSLSWFWMHRRKMLIILILLTMATYTVLFGWINISDIRQAILAQLGLPPDLGLGP